MSCPIEALSSKDTRNIYPNDQRGHPKCERSCAGRRVQVKGPSCKELEVGRIEGSNRAENSGKAFDEAGNRRVVELNWYNCVQPVLWKVAAFANEKEYARMHRISREVRAAVSSSMTVGERLKEIMNLDNIPSTNRHYQHCINHQREILTEIDANISKNTLVKDIVNVAEAQARFNVEDTAGTFKKAREAACYQRKREEKHGEYLRNLNRHKPYIIRAQHLEIKAYIGIAEEQVRLFLKEGAAVTLRELTKILQTIREENGYKSAKPSHVLHDYDFPCHVDFLITTAKLQARLGLKEKDEAANILKEAQNFLEKWLGYLEDELSPRGVSHIPNCRIVRDMFYNTISFIEAQDRLAPEQKVPLSIRRGQKKLQSIMRSQSLKFSYTILFCWINEYITFVKLADPKEAINDLREARKTIKQPGEPPEKIVDALGVVIASAREKIDPKGIGINFTEVYRVAIERKDLPDRCQILQDIVLQGFMLSQKEAVWAFQEVYDILSSDKREEKFVLELTKIDLKKESMAMIVDEMVGSEVQDNDHKALLLTWIAQQHAKFNRKKEAKEKYDHVLDIVKKLQPTEQKKRVLRKIAVGMAEIDHYDKAYEIARDIPSDTYSSNKVKALLKIAKIIREKATSEEDLKKAAVIFEEVREILKTRVGDRIADLLDLFYSSIPVFDQSS